jgi:site-specific recombinase XerD
MSMSMNDDVSAVIGEVERKNSDSTGTRYAAGIRAFAEWCDETDTDPFGATPRVVENYLQYQNDENDYAYQTLTVHRAALVQFYKRAKRLAEDGVIEGVFGDDHWSSPAVDSRDAAVIYK